MRLLGAQCTGSGVKWVFYQWFPVAERLSRAVMRLQDSSTGCGRGDGEDMTSLETENFCELKESIIFQPRKARLTGRPFVAATIVNVVNYKVGSIQ